MLIISDKNVHGASGTATGRWSGSEGPIVPSVLRRVTDGSWDATTAPSDGHGEGA